tara:strand:+ start:801 stop:1481 length:681 start_codon:yes stop_codon:yes gene_type:complete
MATFLKDGVYVYIARENALNDAFSGTTGKHLSTLTKTGVQALGASTTDQKYQQIEDVTGVSIGGYGLEYDTFQTLADNFDHDIEIKEMGSGSVDFIVKSGNNVSNNNLDHLELKAIAKDFPNGYNEVNSNIAGFDTSIDTKTAVDTDDRGYAILVRQVYGGDNLYWCFHNCKISCSISFANRQATRGSMSWEDARYVTFDTSSTELVVGTHHHSDAKAEGFHTATE